ncbi:hypothetical protein CA13_04940 [Planctomycetes bacterium CA13]|uniref:Uncharacterized protein n=1 Tax=Novipirellula herctigrandis TaxID=2527986 RepID=A0A5C5YX19_9BACT|nr:hypothetical protein CA13_04940 [Planctomycetes bacterium CA13]
MRLDDKAVLSRQTGHSRSAELEDPDFAPQTNAFWDATFEAPKQRHYATSV